MKLRKQLGSDQVRLRVSAPGGLSLIEALRLLRVGWQVHRMIRKHGFDEVVSRLEQVAAQQGGRVSVRRWSAPCPSVSRTGHPCANGAGHLEKGIRHGDPFVGASGINWDDPDD